MRINSRLNVRLPTVSGNGEWNETKLHRSKVTWRYFKAKSNEGKMMPTRGFFLLTLQQGLVMKIKLRISYECKNILKSNLFIYSPSI